MRFLAIALLALGAIAAAPATPSPAPSASPAAQPSAPPTTFSFAVAGDRFVCERVSAGVRALDVVPAHVEWFCYKP